jgi:hypothetical protein
MFRRGRGFVNTPGSGRQLRAEHDARSPQLVIEEPTLRRQSTSVPDQVTSLPDDAMARNDDSEMVGRDDLADVAGM